MTATKFMTAFALAILVLSAGVAEAKSFDQQASVVKADIVYEGFGRTFQDR